MLETTSMQWLAEALDSDFRAVMSRVRPNSVQSIRAFKPHELMQAASDNGQHFLYANLAKASSKQEVLEQICAGFHLAHESARDFHALQDALTQQLQRAGSQPGFVVVLEQIPVVTKFDRDAREQLLDVFQDIADYWADRSVEFRAFYSFL